MKKVFTFIFLLQVLSAAALNSSDFTIQRISAPYFVVDGNSPSTGPLTAYAGFKITNTSVSVTYSNLKFTIGSISTSVAGQNFILLSPSSGISVIGTLAPGESKVCYFYVSYPTSTTAQGTFNYTLTDATASSKTGNSVISDRSCISANAGGLAAQSINSQDLIGGIVYDDVTYSLGNVRNGDEADFQISVSTSFDPTKLVLQKTQVTASTISGITAGTDDLLYFITTANQSSGTVTIRWTFKISSYNFTALILPYAGSTSGSSNYKYAISTDLGGGTPIVVSSSANPLLISKISDKTIYGITNTATFTVTIQNPGAFGITIDKITDEIPAGFVYQGLASGTQVTTANATTTPLAGATGLITFEGGVTSGANTSFSIAAGGSLVLKYTAVAPSSQASNLLTTARGYIGITQFGSASTTVAVTATLPLTLVALKGAWVNEKIKLDWTTESENNSSYFEIERNTGSTGFHPIGRIAAHGNFTGRLNYSFSDSFPSAIASYRLKLVDADGKYKYSPVILLRKEEGKQQLTVYPSPFSDHIAISFFNHLEGMGQVAIINSVGVQLTGEPYFFNKGMNSFVVNNLHFLSKGVYIVQVTSGNEIISQQVMK
jgi:uncharacterized repeat protein (TIGR01451 family)